MREPLANYTNLLDRPHGPIVRTLSAVFPGVRSVVDQIEPYAARWGELNRAALRSSGPLWVALGDSMSQGIGASDPERGWVGVARDRLERFRVVNLSQSGARTQDVVDFQIPVLQSLGVAPDLVTVLVGANDLGAPARRAALPDAFDRLLSHLPRRSIVATMPQPGKATDAVNEAIHGAPVVPVSVETNWRGKLAADHFHPNDAGYEAIADGFLPAMMRA